MIALPLWLVPALPLALLVAFLLPGARPGARALVPVAPLPALLAALADPAPAAVPLDWLLLGTEFALTGLAPAFLVFTAALWTLAGWQAVRLLRDDPAQDRFLACFLLAMTGNLGLFIAQDIIAFYSFFSAMSLASWGLVLHGQGELPRLAGRVYIAFAVVGELALFAGLALGAFAAGEVTLSALAGPAVPPVAHGLIAAGLLVKLGAVPLHLWLPLAHAAAPAPASAVLSGAMLKAGLYGLMVLLPLGAEPMPGAAAALAAMALAGLVLAPVLGGVQADPKAVLAYSSLGQMSLMALGLAVVLAAPAAWDAIAPALVLLAAAHAFAKGALFLGVPALAAARPGAARVAVLAFLALPALTLAGLPATGGRLGKEALKAAVADAPEGWLVWLGSALFWASFGTGLLMLRALARLAGAEAKSPPPRDVTLPWLVATGLAVAGLGLLPAPLPASSSVTAADLAPLATAGAVALLALSLAHFGRLCIVPPAPGELLALVRAAPAPLLALPPPPRRGRPLAIRRRPVRSAPVDRGAFALLGIAAALALVMALAPDP